MKDRGNNPSVAHEKVGPIYSPIWIAVLSPGSPTGEGDITNSMKNGLKGWEMILAEQPHSNRILRDHVGRFKATKIVVLDHSDVGGRQSSSGELLLL